MPKAEALGQPNAACTRDKQTITIAAGLVYAAHLLFNQLVDELAQLRLPCVRNERLLAHNLRRHGRDRKLGRATPMCWHGALCQSEVVVAHEQSSVQTDCQYPSGDSLCDASEHQASPRVRTAHLVDKHFNVRLWSESEQIDGLVLELTRLLIFLQEHSADEQGPGRARQHHGSDASTAAEHTRTMMMPGG